METPQTRHRRQDGVRGRAEASGAAGGRRSRPAGREWVSIPAAVAAVDGREMVVRSLAVDAARVRGLSKLLSVSRVGLLHLSG